MRTTGPRHGMHFAVGVFVAHQSIALAGQVFLFR